MPYISLLLPNTQAMQSADGELQIQSTTPEPISSNHGFLTLIVLK